MPAIVAIGGFLGITGATVGAVVLSGVLSAAQSFEQQRQVKRREKKQKKFLAAERAAVGEPEDFEPGIKESFLEREKPRLEGDLAARGLTRSSDFERGNLALGVEGDRLSREAALRRWQATAKVAQQQVEAAFSNQQVEGPGIAESFAGGFLEKSISGAPQGPIFSGATPGVSNSSAMDDDFFGKDIFGTA